MMSIPQGAAVLLSISFIVHSGIFLARTSDSTITTRLQCRGKVICPVAERTRSRNNSTSLTLPAQTQSNFSGILPRSFEPWKNPLPCFEPEDQWNSDKVQNSPADKGFLYVKPYKTGSSTTSGINLRIARNVALRKDRGYGICKGTSMHHENRNVLWLGAQR